MHLFPSKSPVHQADHLEHPRLSPVGLANDDLHEGATGFCYCGLSLKRDFWHPFVNHAKPELPANTRGITPLPDYLLFPTQRHVEICRVFRIFWVEVNRLKKQVLTGFPKLEFQFIIGLLSPFQLKTRHLDKT
jgi:hypothetical protein